MKNIFLLFSLLLCLQIPVQGQELMPEAPFRDSNYMSSIGAVQLHLKGFPLSMPIAKLNQSGKLQLRFDDLKEDTRQFSYKIIHCNAEWRRSQLSRSEFIRGYKEVIFDQYNFSSGTIQPYIHYQTTLPNDDMQWLVSGQYVLIVYLDEHPKRIAFTRRFFVVEPKVNINPEFLKPLNISREGDYHELNFSIDYEDSGIRDPMNEVKVTVLQNRRWREAIKLKSPRYVQANEIVYDEYGQFQFPAGNEFRPLDIRTLQYRAPHIYSIQHFQDGIEVVPNTDEIRAYKNYLTYTDLNGQYLILNKDREGLSEPPRTDTGSANYKLFGAPENLTPHVESEYTDVSFTLNAPQTLRHPVYLTGAFVNWNALPKHRMKYDPVEQVYYTSAYLKQGYYDYYYVEQLPDGSLRGRDTEGNYFETENEYMILVYYRPFGGRYDRVVAIKSMTSGG